MRTVFKHVFAFAHDFPTYIYIFIVIPYLHFTAYCNFINTSSISPQLFLVLQVAICSIFITTPNDNVSQVILIIRSLLSSRLLRKKKNLMGAILFGSLYVKNSPCSLQLKVSFSSYKKSLAYIFSFYLKYFTSRCKAREERE